MVNLYYPYSTIFRRGFTNKFSTAIHMSYLCMKILALHGIITCMASRKKQGTLKEQ